MDGSLEGLSSRRTAFGKKAVVVVGSANNDGRVPPPPEFLERLIAWVGSVGGNLPYVLSMLAVGSPLSGGRH